MLFRFRAQQAADLGIIDAGRTRRPKLITEVNSIPACEKWRGQVLKEISRKVSRIQEPNLSDYQIRDLNDEINRAMREKHMWEIQIRNLGGPNYMRGGKMYDDEGKEIPGGGKGYRYVRWEPQGLSNLTALRQILWSCQRTTRCERASGGCEAKALREALGGQGGLAQGR